MSNWHEQQRFYENWPYSCFQIKAKRGITKGCVLSKGGADFIRLTENIDTTTPSNKLISDLIGVLTEFERDLIRERPNTGLAAAHARAM